MTPAPAGRIVRAVLVLAPVVASIIVAWRFHYDHPYWDEWSFTPLVLRHHEGGLDWATLWAQFHEHRAPVLKLLMVVMARASGWNLFWEVAVSLACGLITLSLLVHQARRLRSVTAAAALAWTAPLFALLVMSPSQWENWTFGLFMHNGISVVCATSGLCILGRRPTTAWRVAAAVLLGFVATYTFVAGVFYWFTGSVIVVLAHRQWRAIVAWCLGLLACMAPFLWGYAGDPQGGKATIGGLVIPALANLGSPILLPAGPATILGALGVMAVVPLSIFAWRARLVGTALPFAGVALYGLVSSAGIAWGRVGQVAGLDFDTALRFLGEFFWLDCRPRYIAYAGLFWIGVFVMLVLVAAKSARRACRVAAVACTLALGGLLVANATLGCRAAARHHHQLKPGRDALLAPDIDAVADADLVLINADPDSVRRYAKALKARRLTIWRK